MRVKSKKTWISLLAGACLFCTGTGLLLHRPAAAFAAENNYAAFVNVGASENAVAFDEECGVTGKNFTATAAGTVTEGDSLFKSYAVNATYTASSLTQGNYDVVIAVLAEAGLEVKVNNEEVTVPEEASGKTVLHTTAENTAEIAIEVTGKLCGAMVAEEGANSLFAVDFERGQVIPYGVLLEDVLGKATAYYSDGSQKDLTVEYGNITGYTGVNDNFTTVENVDATIYVAEGDDPLAVSVKCDITTMPDDLEYFINCGSFTEDGEDPGTADQKYAYNRKIFDYYGGNLINKDANGNYIPDQVSSSSATWGRYTAGTWASPGDSGFPYNSIVWTNTATDLGYYLTGLDAATSYRIWLGTLSHWHARTSDITFNGEKIGNGELVIGTSKGFSVYENVKPDQSGCINIHMTQRGSQNEPTLCFIAVQKMEVEIPAAPSSISGEAIVKIEQTEYVLQGASAGAKLQLYNVAKPNQVLYEELIDEEKIAADGSYTFDWGKPMEVAQFEIVQITKGGLSNAVLVTVTDIEDFEAKLVTEGYTADTAKISLKAHAESGISKWEYRIGDYGTPVVTSFAERPAAIDFTFDVSENGVYYITVTSGRKVSFMGSVEVTKIDHSAPVISLTPSKQGWSAEGYHATLTVESIAPVSEYVLYRNGAAVAEAKSAPETIKFTETGEYTVFVRTETGKCAQTSLHVSDAPTYTKVTKTPTRNGARYTFGNTEDCEVASISVYKVSASGIQRETVVSGNSIELGSRNGAGTYVASIVTATGAVEMFSFTVEKSDLGSAKSGGGNGLGIGLGIGIGGVALAAAAIVTTVVLLKKKKV